MLSNLTFLPVLTRELREGSHRPFNYYLRVLAAGCAMILLWICVEDAEQRMNAQMMGLSLFTALHTFLLLLIITIVPTMTADCISSEKRNGTLGLLFLTPLTARGIMIGKSCAHAFRAFTLWTSALPVLVIPFLLGGIGWFDVGTAIVMQLCAIIISLAAGLLASAIFRKRNSAIGAGFFLALGLNLAVAVWVGFMFSLMVTAAVGTRSRFNVRLRLFDWLPFVIRGSSRFYAFGAGAASSGWSAVVSRTAAMKAHWIQLLGAGVLVSFLLLFIVLFIGAWQIKRSWRDKQSRVPAKWYNRFCTPLFRNHFKAQMRRLLDKNPIAWLQQYSWRARSTKWGMCFAFIVVETAAVSYAATTYDILDSMMVVQLLLLTIASIMFVFVGVNSFQTEKQSGALELILITPLRVKQIIFGRVYGLWKQFLPAYLVVAGCHVACSAMFAPSWIYSGSSWYRDCLIKYFVFALGFVNLPIFATYFALRVKNIIASGILTAFAIFFAPMFGVVVFGMGYDLLVHGGFHRSVVSLLVAIFLGNALFAGLSIFLLHHSLSRRIYSF